MYFSKLEFRKRNNKLRIFRQFQGLRFLVDFQKVFTYSWSSSLRSLAPAKIVPICLVKVHFELRLKVFFPCQCCRSSSSWWCRPCFGGLECWRWWWFDPPRRQAGPFVAWPSPRGGVPPFFKRKSGKSPLCRKALSKTTKSKVANKVLYLWQWETPSAIHSGSKSLKKVS